MGQTYNKWHKHILCAGARNDFGVREMFSASARNTPSFGIHKGKGREAGHETAGAVTWMQM